MNQIPGVPREKGKIRSPFRTIGSYRKQMKEFTGYMKGVDLGGWLSQCNHTTENYERFIVEKDFERIASLGLDHVRMPVDYNLIQNEDGSFKEGGFKYIDNAVSWGKKYGLNVVIDIHKVAGFVFDRESYDFFYEVKYQDMFVELWKELAKRYGQYSDFVSFELLNEVTSAEVAAAWNRIVARTIPEIRKYAPVTKVIVGGIFNNSVYGVTLLDKPYDENTVFTFHCYNPMVFTHQKAGWVPKLPKDFGTAYPLSYGTLKKYSEKYFGNDFAAEFEPFNDDDMIDEKYFDNLFMPAIRVSEKYGVPLYCGEYGVIDMADTASTLNWFKDINKALVNHKIPRAVWSYRFMNFGITDPHYAPIFEELLKVL